MINVSVTFDPSSAADLAQAQAVLDHFRTAAEPEPEPRARVQDPDAVHQKVIALLRGYGRRRTELIREVARRSPEWAQHEDLAAIVGSAAAVLGTHAAIEKAWREKGMPGPFVETDVEGNARMEMQLADIVLFAMHEIDEPDPLIAARY